MTKEEALKLALEALEEAADAIDSWGSYASGYFQVKHDLESDIRKTKSAITTIKEALSSCQCPECKVLLHASDCAVHNEPAYPKGECNCGAQPEQEPWSNVGIGVDVTKEGVSVVGIYKLSNDSSHLFYSQFYTTPPQRTWVGLTEKEKEEAYFKIDLWRECIDFIEAKLKEKNT